jgi:hypothetical protein
MNAGNFLAGKLLITGYSLALGFGNKFFKTFHIKGTA